MASIENLRLEIIEVQGSAVALVNYTLRGSSHDALHQQEYEEVVQLFGIDALPEEDGQHEPIPGGTVFAGKVKFTNSVPFKRPQRVLPLPSSALDEDTSMSPDAVILKEDEIRAQVTLTQIHEPVRANSNVVRRGLFAVGPSVLTPA